MDNRVMLVSTLHDGSTMSSVQWIKQAGRSSDLVSLRSCISRSFTVATSHILWYTKIFYNIFGKQIECVSEKKIRSYRFLRCVILVVSLLKQTTWFFAILQFRFLQVVTNCFFFSRGYALAVCLVLPNPSANRKISLAIPYPLPPDAEHSAYWGQHKYHGPVSSPRKMWAGVAGRPPLMVEVRCMLAGLVVW